MKIIITGGAGFIGSRLGIYLQNKKHEVSILDNLEYSSLENLKDNKDLLSRFVRIDIRDQNLENTMIGTDVVFHFAGIRSLPECNNNPAEAFQCNVAGTANVLEMARRNNVKKIIFASTSAVYENETVYPFEESMQPKPTLIYALTKKSSEDICRSYSEMYDMDITILRFFNVYGPSLDYLHPNPSLVSYIIRCFLKKETPTLHSDGRQARDEVFIDDVMRMCEIVMTHPKAKNEVFNVGSGRTTTVQDIFHIIAKSFTETKTEPVYREAKLIWEKYQKLFEGKYPLKSTFIEKEVNKYTIAGTNKAREFVGWEAKIHIEEGLSKTVAYAKKKGLIVNL